MLLTGLHSCRLKAHDLLRVGYLRDDGGGAAHSSGPRDEDARGEHDDEVGDERGDVAVAGKRLPPLLLPPPPLQQLRRCASARSSSLG